MIFNLQLIFEQNAQGFYLYLFENEFYLYLVAILPFIYSVYVIFYKGIELTKAQLLVLVFTFLLIVIIFLYQAIFEVDYNAMGYICVFIILSLVDISSNVIHLGNTDSTNIFSEILFICIFDAFL